MGWRGLKGGHRAWDNAGFVAWDTTHWLPHHGHHGLHTMATMDSIATMDSMATMASMAWSRTCQDMLPGVPGVQERDGWDM